MLVLFLLPVFLLVFVAWRLLGVLYGASPAFFFLLCFVGAWYADDLALFFWFFGWLAVISAGIFVILVFLNLFQMAANAAFHGFLRGMRRLAIMAYEAAVDHAVRPRGPALPDVHD